MEGESLRLHEQRWLIIVKKKKRWRCNLMVYLIFVATHEYCASYILHTNATVCPVPVGCFGQTLDASLLALCIFLHLLLRSVSMELVSNMVAFHEGNSSGNKDALTPTQLYWQHFVNDLTTTGVDSE
jgi:hypothetical protein